MTAVASLLHGENPPASSTDRTCHPYVPGASSLTVIAVCLLRFVPPTLILVPGVAAFQYSTS